MAVLWTAGVRYLDVTEALQERLDLVPRSLPKKMGCEIGFYRDEIFLLSALHGKLREKLCYRGLESLPDTRCVWRLPLLPFKSPSSQISK